MFLSDQFRTVFANQLTFTFGIFAESDLTGLKLSYSQLLQLLDILTTSTHFSLILLKAFALITNGSNSLAKALIEKRRQDSDEFHH